jgi:hypothetical protein
MWQLLYSIAFGMLASLAIVNLVRSMMRLGMESNRSYPNGSVRRFVRSADGTSTGSEYFVHPELFDEDGNLTDEPLLVMKSIDVEEARARLDALYESGGSD